MSGERTWLARTLCDHNRVIFHVLNCHSPTLVPHAFLAEEPVSDLLLFTLSLVLICAAPAAEEQLGAGGAMHMTLFLLRNHC